MRRYTKKTQHHTARIIQIILVVIFSLRSCSVNGQISHRTEYDIAPGRRSVAATNSAGDGDGGDGASTDDTGKEQTSSNQPNGIRTNGEILGPKSFPLSAQEPSCEQLRAMWIFSKRQSRAAEMSNEIPTYRDPFEFNVWEPIYPPGRGIGGPRTSMHYRDSSRPVFGRIISREPIVLQRLPPVRTRMFDDVQSRFYGSETRSAMPSVHNGSRRYIKYRFSGSAPYGNSQGNNPNIVHQGSFQKLKELIWTERAKELTQQRRAEELAARAAALKEIAAGQLINTHQEQNDEPVANEENLSPDLKEQHYHHNTDSRISLANSQQAAGVMKSIFSANPSNTNSARAGRLLLPSMIGNDGRDRANLQRSFPMRPSHFRERNRVLYRQTTPSDFYQRDLRSESLQTGLSYKVDPKTYSPSDSNVPYLNDDVQQSTEMDAHAETETDAKIKTQEEQKQELLTDIFQNIYQIDQMSFLTEYPSSSSSSKSAKFNFSDNDKNGITIKNLRNIMYHINRSKDPLISSNIY